MVFALCYSASFLTSVLSRARADIVYLMPYCKYCLPDTIPAALQPGIECTHHVHHNVHVRPSLVDAAWKLLTWYCV